MTAALLGIARHALTTVGGYLVAQGVITDGQATELVGALTVLIGLAWSIIEKRRRG